jgi:hypothetical protein
MVFVFVPQEQILGNGRSGLTGLASRRGESPKGIPSRIRLAAGPFPLKVVLTITVEELSNKSGLAAKFFFVDLKTAIPGSRQGKNGRTLLMASKASAVFAMTGCTGH